MTVPGPTLVADASFVRRFFAALNAASIGWAVALAALAALAMSPIFVPPLPVLFGRTVFIAIVLLLAYTAAGQWRQAAVPRWVVQVAAVALAAPLATLAVYALTTGGDFARMFGQSGYVSGILILGGCSLMLGLIIGLGAIVRERDAQAEAAVLGFALERETLQRQAADARLALLQSQVEPHFLFNTLANVQALVETGSPRAAPVLASLIAYLRAALPRLQEGAPTLGRERALVEAYLDLMHLRMPDRLAFTVDIDPGLDDLRVPPMTLLTLVENAVRHGIDPGESGGRIEVGARRDASGQTLRLWVEDTGVGMDESGSPGTGLANLRARLAAAYGSRARLELTAVRPHGVRAEIELPCDD